MTTALAVRDLHVRYGHIAAVKGISFAVEEGEVVALLGANGAGKSSTLNAVCGNSPGSVRGEVELFGERIAGRPAHALVRRGMVLVPEGRQIVAPLTVEENLRLGAYHRRARRQERRLLDEVHELFPVLRERRSAPGGLLSGGEQQMLAFGRALMADPSLIVMDEPSMGLAPAMVQRVMEAVVDINRRGVSILLVEQNAAASLPIASRVYVLDQGQVVKDGPADEIASDPAIAEAFLGLRERAA